MRDANRVKDPDTGIHVLNFAWDTGFYCGINNLVLQGPERVKLEGAGVRDQFFHGLSSGRQMRVAMLKAAKQHEPTGDDNDSEETGKQSEAVD